MVLEKICTPALIYLMFSITQIIMDTIKGRYSVAFVKVFVTFVFTVLLNFLCVKGLGVISWIVVLIPFVLMTVIVAMLLFILGLDPVTGEKLDGTETEGRGSETEGRGSETEGRGTRTRTRGRGRSLSYKCNTFCGGGRRCTKSCKMWGCDNCSNITLKTAKDALLASSSNLVESISPGKTYVSVESITTTGEGRGLSLSYTSTTEEITSITVITGGRGYKIGDKVIISSSAMPGRISPVIFSLTVDDFIKDRHSDDSHRHSDDSHRYSDDRHRYRNDRHRHYNGSHLDDIMSPEYQHTDTNVRRKGGHLTYPYSSSYNTSFDYEHSP
jgi:hypothetical protein